jgi:hypothetical protein
VAGGACRRCEPRNPREDLGADLAYEVHVRGVREPLGSRAVHRQAVAQSLLQRSLEAVPESSDRRHSDPPRRHLARGAEPDCEQDVLGPSAKATFVSGAVDERLDPRPAADEHGADPLRRVELVPRHREEIHAELADAGRDLPDALRGVGVQWHPRRARDRRDVRDGLDRADLVVRVHDADEDRPRRDRLPDVSSSGSQPSSGATCARARSTAALAGAPAQWWLEGFP